MRLCRASLCIFQIFAQYTMTNRYHSKIRIFSRAQSADHTHFPPGVYPVNHMLASIVLVVFCCCCCCVCSFWRHQNLKNKIHYLRRHHRSNLPFWRIHCIILLFGVFSSWSLRRDARLVFDCLFEFRMIFCLAIYFFSLLQWNRLIILEKFRSHLFRRAGLIHRVDPASILVWTASRRSECHSHTVQSECSDVLDHTGGSTNKHNLFWRRRHTLTRRRISLVAKVDCECALRGILRRVSRRAIFYEIVRRFCVWVSRFRMPLRRVAVSLARR